MDTIAAIATPPGKGGVGIVRISGPRARSIGETITGKNLKPRYAHYGDFHLTAGRDSAAVLDSGIALYFVAPHSFTGEDVVELQGHGGQVVLDLLLREILALGARMARAGEFSERAFLNDKIDLAQAEAIADLIDSASEQAARNAMHSLQGDFSHTIDELVEAVIQLRMYVEAAIDFPEEEIDFLSDGHVATQLDGIEQRLQEVFRAARQGSLLREGMTLVIAGRPNAGKSSLLNALAGNDIAIVTDIAGTTRDVLREHIQIDGLPLHIVDTAGLRDGADIVEQEGIRRAQREIERADRVLLVIDATQPLDLAAELALLPGPIRNSDRITVLFNKSDVAATTSITGIDSLAISARTGSGIDDLKQYLKGLVGYDAASGSGFSARRRHLDALTRGLQHLAAARTQLLAAAAGELVAEDLRQCQLALSEITGAFTSDELLGRIFSSFCIGK
jgi:tRNA modification GTPase